MICSISLLSHAAVSAEEETCRLYQRVMNNLGVSMSRHRLLISSTEDRKIIDAATTELEHQTSKYRRIKRQFYRERCQGWSRN